MSQVIDKPVERATNGRFLKGHKIPGPGRPSKHGHYQAVFDKEFSTAHFKQAIWKLYEMALSGDMKAMSYFLDRCLGKVKDVQEVTLVNQDTRSPEELRQEFLSLVQANVLQTAPNQN